MVIVSFAVTESVPEIAMGWVAEQVGGSIAPDGPLVIAHVSATVPVKPLAGATVTVEVALPPGEGTLTGVPLIAKLGVEPAAVTETASVVVCVTPEPMAVTVAV